MKAFVVDHYGKKAKVQLAEIPVPAVNSHEVLVEVHAASVNLLDSKIKNGEFKLLLAYKPPFTLGHDVAGVVVKVGSLVEKFQVGDEVFSRPSDYKIGTYAEFISINENDLALKPKSLTMVEAASIPLVGLTAWQALIEKAHLQKGQKVFIQAGSGGVGTFAIQLAQYIGATVATTTSSANIEMVKKLGADVVIDYKNHDFATSLYDYDVVLNSQDSKTLEKSLNILKAGGQLISISGPPDINFANEIGLPWLMKQIMRLLSFKIRKKANQRKVDYSFLFMRANGKQLGEIATLIDSGKIRPLVDRVFPFESTNEAIEYVEQGHTKGKVIVKVK